MLDNIDHIKEYKKKWRLENKEQAKQYRLDNKDHILETKKIYYQDNKEVILEKKRKKYGCECGSEIRISDKQKHNKTIKHQNYLKGGI